jgi:CrcB protein
MNIILISIFGVLGVLSRYSIETLLGNKNHIFPIATLFANVLGCLLAGCLYTLMSQKDSANQQYYLTIIIGFCGGLTTFSGYALQTLGIMESGQLLKGISYLIISPALGLICVLIGMKLTSLAS